MVLLLLSLSPLERGEGEDRRNPLAKPSPLCRPLEMADRSVLSHQREEEGQRASLPRCPSSALPSFALRLPFPLRCLPFLLPLLLAFASSAGGESFALALLHEPRDAAVQRLEERLWLPKEEAEELKLVLVGGGTVLLEGAETCEKTREGMRYRAHKIYYIRKQKKAMHSRMQSSTAESNLGMELQGHS